MLYLTQSHFFARTSSMRTNWPVATCPILHWPPRIRVCSTSIRCHRQWIQVFGLTEVTMGFQMNSYSMENLILFKDTFLFMRTRNGSPYGIVNILKRPTVAAAEGIFSALEVKNLAPWFLLGPASRISTWSVVFARPLPHAQLPLHCWCPPGRAKLSKTHSVNRRGWSNLSSTFGHNCL